MSQPILLVPLDGTPAARAALPAAKALGDIFGASPRILHVSGEKPSSLRDIADRLGLARAGLEAWSIETQAGDPSAAILKAARALEARFIVMCAHTAAARADGPLGSTALGVLKAAPCPVVLVRPSLQLAGWRPQRIVLPYDGGPAGESAVRLASEVARLADADVVVLLVGAAGVRAPAEAGGSMGMPRYVDQPHHEWPSWADELLERLACQCPEGRLHAHLKLRGGEPGAEILRFAAEESADLIVLGWKGEWGGEHAATLKAVLRGAPCPVVVVRGAAAP